MKEDIRSMKVAVEGCSLKNEGGTLLQGGGFGQDENA